LPELGDLPLKSITPLTVRQWYATLDPEHPTRRAHAYSLLRTILGNAVSDDMLASNPCHVRGGGNARRKRKIVPERCPNTANLPDRYRLMVLLASWCALRFGELTELRRSDIDLKNGKVMIKRGVVWVGGGPVVGPPKSSAGVHEFKPNPQQNQRNNNAEWRIESHSYLVLGDSIDDAADQPQRAEHEGAAPEGFDKPEGQESVKLQVKRVGHAGLVSFGLDE
jgi:hypothetical protein